MAEIAIANVYKSYGRDAVIHGVDVMIDDGKFVVILGPSGCGKSTLLRMIAGLETITTGEISIGGEVVNDLEPRARGCAMVFQNYALYPHMSVADNIGYGLKVAGMKKSERMQKIKSVAEMLALSDYLQRKPAELSGGQRQRVAIGRAMIREPKVFLYDEPLSNLDAKLRVRMRVEIRKLHQKLGTTSVFVTHDQTEALSLADTIIVMQAGRIEQIGTPREIYHHPASVFVAGFIGTPGMTIIDGVIDRDKQCLVLGDGQTLPLDSARYPEGASQESRAVKIGLRAEHIMLGASADVSSDTLSFQAKFDFLEEMGAAQQVHCEVAGQTLIALAHTPSHFLPNEMVTLHIAKQHIHLFDAQTGRRLPEHFPALEDIIAAPDFIPAPVL